MSDIRTILVTSFASLGLTVMAAGSALATTITGTLTADNHYALFTANEDFTDISFVGRNELGPSDTSGYCCNWSNAETWNFNIDNDDYIYVVAWDDKAVNESWIGEFTSNTGESILSSVDDWEYLISIENADNPTWGFNPENYGPTPGNDDLAFQVVSANDGITNDWLTPLLVGLNGTSPWGNIAGISNNAAFLNTTTAPNQIPGTQGNTRYTIFRTQVPVVKTPESSSVLGLLSLGLIIGGLRLKRYVR